LSYSKLPDHPMNPGKRLRRPLKKSPITGVNTMLYFDLKAAVVRSEAKVLSGHAIVARRSPALWKIVRLGFGYGKILGQVKSILRPVQVVAEKAEQQITPEAGYDPRFADLLHHFRDLMRSLEDFYAAMNESETARRFKYQLRFHKSLIDSLAILIDRIDSKLTLQKAYHGLFSEDQAARNKAEDDLLNALFGAESVAQDSLR